MADPHHHTYFQIWWPFSYKKLQTYFSIVHCIQSPWDASVWQNFTFLVNLQYFNLGFYLTDLLYNNFCQLQT